MTIEFGLFMPSGSHPDDSGSFLSEVDAAINGIPAIKSLWMADHFFWTDQRFAFESWTTLAYLAGKYPEKQIGPMVLSQAYRNPAMLAKMGATLQVLSGGRFVMGLGAGWKEDEFQAYGYAYPRAGIRIQQMDETLTIIRKMWHDADPVSYEGEHYRIANAYCQPKPAPAPPIMVGCNGYHALKVAAKHADWWNSSGDIQHFHEKLDILNRHCDAIGRDVSHIRITRMMPLAVATTETEAKKLTKGMGRKTVSGTPQQIIEEVAPFIELGVDYFMFELPPAASPELLALMANDIIPGILALK